jgi:hypothetical protein
MSTDSVDAKGEFDTWLCGLIQLRVRLTVGGVRFTLTSCIATKQ